MACQNCRMNLPPGVPGRVVVKATAWRGSPSGCAAGAAIGRSINAMLTLHGESAMNDNGNTRREFGIPAMQLSRRRAVHAIAAATTMPWWIDMARAKALATIRAALIPIESAASLYYARDNGFFRKVGLDVQIAQNPSTPALAAAVAPMISPTPRYVRLRPDTREGYHSSSSLPASATSQASFPVRSWPRRGHP